MKVEDKKSSTYKHVHTNKYCLVYTAFSIFTYFSRNGRLHGKAFGPCSKPFPSKQGYTMTPLVCGCFWRVVMSRIRLANAILKFIYENTNLPMCTSPRQRPGGGPAERSEQHCAGRRSTLDYNTGSIEWPQGAL